MISMKKIPAKFKIFLINLLVALILVCGISTYVLYWLDDYTEHGSFITVPSLQNFTPEEAQTITAQMGLKIQVIDSLYDDNIEPGAIVEQYPTPGSYVKEGRMLHLTINARNPEKVVFPNLKNAAYRQTLQTLEARGFQIGKIEYIPSEFRNLVLALKHNGVDVLPNELLAKGAIIDIVLGNGNNNTTVTVPFLLGKKLKDAIKLIRKSYLNIGEVIPDGSITPENRSNSIIYQQNPDTEFPIEQGSAIDLYITADKEKITALDTILIKK